MPVLGRLACAPQIALEAWQCDICTAYVMASCVLFPPDLYGLDWLVDSEVATGVFSSVQEM